MRRASFFFSALFVVGLPLVANALTLGEWRVVSQPGQPFQAKADLMLDDKETIQSLTIGSDRDYALIHIARPDGVDRLTVQIKQEGEQAIVWLKSPVVMRHPDAVILLRIASNQHTYLPFFRMPATEVSPATVTEPARPGRRQTATTRAKTVEKTATTPKETADSESTEIPQTGDQKTGDQRKKYGPVRSGETLTSIAHTVARGTGVPPIQAETAIWQHNPEQFTLHNMNGLKIGGLLVIPSLEEMARINPDEAQRLWNNHVAEWQKPVAQRKPSPLPLPVPPTGATTPDARTENSQRTPTAPLPNPNRPVKAEPNPLHQIVGQLQSILSLLEKHQTQLETLTQRVSALEGNQDFVKKIDQRLSNLEEHFK